MNTRLNFLGSLFLVVGVCPILLRADEASTTTTVGDNLVTEYFRAETDKLASRTFAEIKTLDDWEQRREEYRRQLFEMLGMDPMPAWTPLEPEVTGEVKENEFIVERLNFQSMPGLYVTANLYRPLTQQGKLPAILYVCGHGRVKKDGVSYGNKTHYQHHGAWFARNGYVCLTIDTIQLGEIEGLHHGTYREKMWWWNNRGYSPAGVEAWNCIRAIDYLQSRDEVDGDRIGVTGRSGGGAYSWWIAALDERIKVAVPVAGITSLHNHVVDGCVEGHCDCMYQVNTYGWDYPMVAALVAPRPLLISNTDKDGIFPLDGVVDVYAKTRRIYDLYDARNKLGLHITEGPHKDTQELRVHAFRWFNRFLKNDDALLSKTATKFFEPEQLKVFDELPSDERVTSIHESFVPAISADQIPDSRDAFESSQTDWMQSLRDKVFRGWPQIDEIEALKTRQVLVGENEDVRVRVLEFTSQSPYRLPMYVVEPLEVPPGSGPASLSLYVLDQERWETTAAGLAVVLPDHFKHVSPDRDRLNEIVEIARRQPDSTVVYCVPRGVGPSEWNRDERERTHIRRRFMLLGQTAAGMQIWDIRRALQALNESSEFKHRQRQIHARGDAAVCSLYASLFEPNIAELNLQDLPKNNREAPDLLNVSRFVEMPHLLLMAADRCGSVGLAGGDADAWRKLLAIDWVEEGNRIRVTNERAGE